MGSSTYELLRTLVHPQVPATLELEDVLATLKAHFSSQPLVITKRFKFYHRSQREGESVVEFLAALRKLSPHCEVGAFLVDALRDRFVCGLRGSNSQKKLLTEDQLTLTRASAIAHSMEEAARQSTQMRDVLTDSPIGVGKLTMGRNNSLVLECGSGSKSTRNGMNGERNAGGSAGKRDSCYRCTKRGHLPQDCKWKDASCHKCHKRGHISPACRAPRKPNVTKYVESSNVHNDTEKEDLQLFTIRRGGRYGSLMMSAKIAGVDIEMETDTGAAVSLISETI